MDGGTIYRDWKEKDESGFQDGDGENTSPLRPCMYVTSLRYPSAIVNLSIFKTTELNDIIRDKEGDIDK